MNDLQMNDSLHQCSPDVLALLRFMTMETPRARPDMQYALETLYNILEDSSRRTMTATAATT